MTYIKSYNCFICEKLGTDPRIGQSACCGLCREPFFSGAVALSIAVDDFTKGCHVHGLLVGSVRGAYVDWHRKRTWGLCLWLPSSSNLLD
jgi:hypothetical protein